MARDGHWLKLLIAVAIPPFDVLPTLLFWVSVLCSCLSFTENAVSHAVAERCLVTS